MWFHVGFVCRVIYHLVTSKDLCDKMTFATSYRTSSHCLIWRPNRQQKMKTPKQMLAFSLIGNKWVGESKGRKGSKGGWRLQSLPRETLVNLSLREPRSSCTVKSVSQCKSFHFGKKKNYFSFPTIKNFKREKLTWKIGLGLGTEIFGFARKKKKKRAENPITFRFTPDV